MSRPPSGMPRDPLIAALVSKLPAQGPFSAEQREAWLNMMRLAFDVAYGGENLHGGGLIAANGGGLATRMMPEKPPHAGYDFYIDAEGHAHMDGGVPVNATDVPADEMVYDYRRGEKRDREAIIWADGSIGAAPGMAFCGPG